jgi:hypothetical protein
MAITGFPSGGYNFQAKTPNVATNYVSGTTATTTVTAVTGSGLLTGISQAMGGTAGSAKLIINLDGVEVYNDDTGIDYSGNQTISMAMAHKFNSSMTIQHNVSSTSGNLRTIVTYLTN